MERNVGQQPAGAVRLRCLAVEPAWTRKLYESLGFKVESHQENYFGDGEARLVLVLTFRIL
jgi:hypothetical protein